MCFFETDCVSCYDELLYLSKGYANEELSLESKILANKKGLPSSRLLAREMTVFSKGKYFLDGR